jgi:hypothetical protein
MLLLHMQIRRYFNKLRDKYVYSSTDIIPRAKALGADIKVSCW